MKTDRCLAGFLLALPLLVCAAERKPACTPDDVRKVCVKKKPAEKKPLPPRRAVPSPPVSIYPQTPSPAAPLAVRPVPPATTSPAVPQVPVPAVGCDAGGCRDANGARYESGAPGTYLNGSGRLCQRNGAFMQCF
jgi:hypothetical protein